MQNRGDHQQGKPLNLKSNPVSYYWTPSFKLFLSFEYSGHPTDTLDSF